MYRCNQTRDRNSMFSLFIAGKKEKIICRQRWAKYHSYRFSLTHGMSHELAAIMNMYLRNALYTNLPQSETLRAIHLFIIRLQERHVTHWHINAFQQEVHQGEGSASMRSLNWLRKQKLRYPSFQGHAGRRRR